MFLKLKFTLSDAILTLLYTAVEIYCLYVVGSLYSTLKGKQKPEKPDQSISYTYASGELITDMMMVWASECGIFTSQSILFTLILIACEIFVNCWEIFNCFK